MHFDPNPLFYEMVEIYATNKHRPEVVTICNEGSTRSSKTWDFFHFLVMYCENNQNAKNEIYILRETLTDCKDYTLKEFKKCLQTIKIWNEDNYSSPQKPYYNLFGNDVYFRGLDDSAEGYPSDIIFINEALENKNKEKVESLVMRCRKLAVYDWNPKYTMHWCFDLEGQANTHFTHSTYKNNKHLELSVVKNIEKYEPTPENIKAGTADEYRWKVYGLGIRSAPEGLIFNNVRYVDSWDDDIAFIYGIDFGFTTDPTALVKVGCNETDIFCELLLYEPTENQYMIDDYCKAKGIDTSIYTIADSSDKYTGENKGTIEMVHGLRSLGWTIDKVSKTKSVMYWLGEMKQKRINIVNNQLVHHARKEQENYTFKMINGIAINQPVDKFNHFWDAVRYGFMSLNDVSYGFI